jgi:flagellar biosynthesis protein
MQRYRSAIALSYETDGEQAPEVSLQGDYFKADEIVALAKKYGVPVIEDAALVDSLRKLEEGEEIPPTLFQAVALVLAKILKN